MKLTEFLLARIAEDEEHPRGIGALQLVFDEAGEYPTGGVKVPARWLAECEAKRRIVELHEPGGGAWCTSTCASEGPTGCETLRVLATAYDNHPDYDERWRP